MCVGTCIYNMYTLLEIGKLTTKLLLLVKFSSTAWNLHILKAYLNKMI